MITAWQMDQNKPTGEKYEDELEKAAACLLRINKLLCDVRDTLSLPVERDMTSAEATQRALMLNRNLLLDDAASDAESLADLVAGLQSRAKRIELWAAELERSST